MMLLSNTREKIFCKLYFYTTILLLLSTILGIRICSPNSVGIISLLLIWIIEGNFKSKFNHLKREPFFFISTIYYCLYILSIAISQDKKRALSAAQNELPLLILPLIFFSKKMFTKKAIVRILKNFVYGTAVWMSIATIISLKKYFETGNISVIFYHSLVEHLLSNAVYAGALCIISLAIILYVPASRNWKILMFIIFSIWILMVSSKMFFFIFLVITSIHVYTQLPKIYKIIGTCILSIIVICVAFTNNPMKRRFEDMEKFKTDYLTRSIFNENMYFDDLSLRLIYWRYSFEIMKEKQQYLFGTGTGDAKKLLDDKIRAYHMNTGNGAPQDSGYLKYSFDCAYLKTIVALGFSGIVMLLFFFGYTGYSGIKNKMPLLRNVFIIISISSISDSIMIDCQCDIVLILIIIYLSVRLFEIERDTNNIKKVIASN